MRQFNETRSLFISHSVFCLRRCHVSHGASEAALVTDAALSQRTTLRVQLAKKKDPLFMRQLQRCASSPLCVLGPNGRSFKSYSIKFSFLPNQINSLGQPYDYDSVMHYGPRSFSVSKEDTLIAKQDRNIGQRRGLSVGDILQARLLYRCHSKQGNCLLWCWYSSFSLFFYHRQNI